MAKNGKDVPVVTADKEHARLHAIDHASQERDRAQQAFNEARAACTKAHKDWKTKQETLDKVLRAKDDMPLLDGIDLGGWEDQPTSALGLGPMLTDLLEELGNGTIGELMAQADCGPLTQIEGISEKMADEINDKLADFFAAHPEYQKGKKGK